VSQDSRSFKQFSNEPHQHQPQNNARFPYQQNQRPSFQDRGGGGGDQDARYRSNRFDNNDEHQQSWGRGSSQYEKSNRRGGIHSEEDTQDFPGPNSRGSTRFSSNEQSQGFPHDRPERFNDSRRDFAPYPREQQERDRRGPANDDFRQGNNYNNRRQDEYSARRPPLSNPSSARFANDHELPHRERSRTMSGDFDQQRDHQHRGGDYNRGFPSQTRGGFGRNIKDESHERQHTRPEDSVDLKDIEASRREAEYLEAAKSQQTKPSARSSLEQHGREERGLASRNYDQQQPSNFESSRKDQSDYGSRDYHQEDHRASGSFQAQNRGGWAAKEIPDDRWDRTRLAAGQDQSRGYESVRGGGGQRGADAVKVAFPSSGHGEPHLQDNRYISDQYSRPVSMNMPQSTAPHQSRDREYPTTQDANKSFGGIFGKNQHHGLPDEGERYHDENIKEVSFQHDTSRSEGYTNNNTHSRPKLLFDPRSNQMIEGDQKKTVSSSAVPEKKGESDRWSRGGTERKPFENTSTRDGGSQQDHSGGHQLRHEVVPSKRPTEEVKAEPVFVDEKKLARQREREQRPPRTKGFLYKFNHSGELEQVLSEWEKNQLEIEKKKAPKKPATENNEEKVFKKRTESEGIAPLPPAPPVWNSTNTAQHPAFAGKDHKSSTETLARPEKTESLILGSLDHQDNALLSNLVGPLLFESWKNPSTGGEINSESRMNWLTNTPPVNNDTNSPAFNSGGLSALGSNFAGIMTSNPTTTHSIFSTTQPSAQDWAYNNILSSAEPSSSSYNPNNLTNNTISHTNSFNSFSGIMTNPLEIIQPEKSKEKEDEENAKYFQRQWQRIGLGQGEPKQTHHRSKDQSHKDSTANEPTTPQFIPKQPKVDDIIEETNVQHGDQNEDEPTRAHAISKTFPNSDHSRSFGERGRGGGRGRNNSRGPPRKTGLSSPPNSDTRTADNPKTFETSPRVSEKTEKYIKTERPKSTNAKLMEHEPYSKPVLSHVSEKPERSQQRSESHYSNRGDKGAPAVTTASEQRPLSAEIDDPSQNRNTTHTRTNGSNQSYPSARVTFSRPTNAGRSYNNSSRGNGGSGGRGHSSGPRRQSEVVSSGGKPTG
jgi:hypothetical protein